jgi:hypothetical protein
MDDYEDAPMTAADLKRMGAKWLAKIKAAESEALANLAAEQVEDDAALEDELA